MTAPLLVTDGPKLSAMEMQALLESCRARQGTGVFVSEVDGDKTQVLYLKRGEVVTTGLASAQAYENIPVDAWRADTKSLAAAQARWIPLSAQGTLLVKLLLQNPGGKTEAFTQAGEIGKILEQQQKIPAVSLVKLQWESALGAVVCCGLADARYSLYLSPEAAQEQVGVLPVLMSPSLSNYRATVSGADPSMAAWQEYLLRRAFTDICEGVLSRLQTVAGRAVADSLLRLAQVFVSRRNLDIHFEARKVVDEEFFASPQESAGYYRSLLADILIHCAGISGARLLSATLQEIVTSWPAQERAVVENFSLLNKGYAYERNR